MHAASYYEKYLVDEYRRHRSGIPNWLKHENEVYEWILELGRCMRVPLSEPKSSVSKKLLYRINNIETIRFGRYENISDELKGAVSMIKTELNSLGIDLRMDATLWKDKELLILSQVEFKISHNGCGVFLFIL